MIARVLYLVVGFLLLTFVPLWAQADGLYWVSDSPTNIPIKTTNGENIFLDQPFTDEIDGTELVSISDDNSKFQCFIHQPKVDPTNRAIALVSQGTCILIQGRGTANMGWFHNGIVSAPLETDKLSAFFHVQALKRVRPDHQLSMKLLVNEGGYTTSEPITAEFRITNDSAKPIVLRQPLTIATRDGNLTFQATRHTDAGTDEKVGVIASKLDSGVHLMVSDPTQNISGALAPGESISVTVDLKEYLHLDNPGAYNIRTTCALALVPAEVDTTSKWAIESEQWGLARTELEWAESPFIDTKLQINGH